MMKMLVFNQMMKIEQIYPMMKMEKINNINISYGK